MAATSDTELDAVVYGDIENVQVGDSGTDEKTQAFDVNNNNNRAWDWDKDPENPYNWPGRKKWAQVAMISSFAIIASLGTSIMAPATTQLQEEFGITLTQSIVPLSLYTFALGLGPVLGGPLSETVGRYSTFIGLGTLGALFTLGVGLVHNFAGLCILRFLAGFCFGPSLAVSAGLLNDVFKPVQRGPPSALFVLMPFLGPGIAPLIGAFVVNRKGWRWTQWTMLFFFVQALLVGLAFGRETYAPVLKRRKAKKLGLPQPPSTPIWIQVKVFIVIALVRPVMMLLTEPIVTFICLYVACVYHFGIESTGLVYISIVVGCLLGFVTIVLCDIFFYRPQIPRHPPHQVPPEWRLVPAMIGSLGIPLGVFWFGWTARPDIHWASPAVAIAPFAWGNICLFVTTMQYMVDTYHGTTVASAASANSLARYGLAGAFPLFTVQMYERLGIGWASSLLGFIAVALLPVPWVLFKYGKEIRARSKYETASW
ncbi:MFS general substrate transporter [Cryphonectria parasitica EP155]|uniref:MFS general substrate transporter n=1 Tax=Cryphonectria parasitica (strain ATCC 38755 / EP155) TaxID=660469 RepID=A0A9P4Y1W9_CRYP1|nr:MFS general substrate transporter [Cryphonectria parasitica EP155]KAF3764832.1 MFS general substrate transporter [Cryphonectria parasitica EP155]